MLCLLPSRRIYVCARRLPSQRQAAAIALFFSIFGSTSNQRVVASVSDIRERLELVVKDDWRTYDHNDALQVLKVLQFFCNDPAAWLQSSADNVRLPHE